MNFIRRRSLLRHLLAWTLGALLIVWASFVIVGFRTGVHEADELTDGHLASVASLLLSRRDGRFVAGSASPGSAPRAELKGHDYQQSMSIAIWDADGRLLTHSGEAPQPPFSTGEGFADLQLGTPPAAWRTFSRWDAAQPPAQRRKVMVMLSVKERDELAEDIGEQVTEPGLWLLPVIALALGLAIRRGLSPLHELSRDVRALDVHQPTPLPARHPHEEFEAVVASINTLVERQHAALMNERQLASELAHELRTPLSSLSLHARLLRESPGEAERANSLAHIEREAQRAAQVVSDLLALARASRTELDEAQAALDIAELSARVVAEYAQPAMDAGHELALVGDGPFKRVGHAVLLELALRNLIENALHHTPRGTLVEVQFDAASGWLQVCDNGTSHATSGLGADKPQAAGLGLGHRVVEKVANIHNARFAAVPAPAGFSTCYRIEFGAESRTATPLPLPPA